MLAQNTAPPATRVKAHPQPPGTGVVPLKERAVLPGLDPTVVGAARQAGIPEAQLRKMSDLAMAGAAQRTHRSLAPKAKAKAFDALDESEEKPDVEALEGAPKAGEAVSEAVVTLSKILVSMQKDKEKGSDLEHLLDRADGGGDGAGGVGAARSRAAAYQKLKGLLRSAPEQLSASVESLMMEDFAQVLSGPRQESTVCSARGWIEHRSHLQQYAGPIRSACLWAG